MNNTMETPRPAATIRESVTPWPKCIDAGARAPGLGAVPGARCATRLPRGRGADGIPAETRHGRR